MCNRETTDETGGGVRTDGGEEEVFRQTILAVDDLYATKNSFLANSVDKFAMLQKQYNSALELIDSIPPENRKSPVQRSLYEYLKGKILDSVPQYKKEAEIHLTKALTLDPSRGDAWLTLGSCLCKKGDLAEAKKCLGIALSKGPNKKILVELSMIEREIAQVSKQNQVLLQASINHAKQAVAIDVKDGFSWCNLGNAYMDAFIINGAGNLKDLDYSLKAYKNAEKDVTMRYNPDLCYNSSQVNRYFEKYERALSGFEAAALMDPALKANEEIRKMINYFDKVLQVIEDFSVIKAYCESQNMIATLVQGECELKPPIKCATLNNLQEGVNNGFAIIAKVFRFLVNDFPTPRPRFFIIIDKEYNFYVLSIYGLDSLKVHLEDTVTILNPCYQHQDFSWKGKHYKYHTLRVDFSSQLHVNESVLLSSQFDESESEVPDDMLGVWRGLGYENDIEECLKVSDNLRSYEPTEFYVDGTFDEE